MTPQEWKEVETRLKDFFDIVKLDCDGYNISLSLERVTSMQNAIRVYINGYINSEYIFNDCEERRRFYRPVSKFVRSSKSRAKFKKGLSKKELAFIKKEHAFDIDRKYTYYLPEWNSFKAFKAHLIKHNKNIQLIKKEASGHEENRSQREGDNPPGENSIRFG